MFTNRNSSEIWYAILCIKKVLRDLVSIREEWCKTGSGKDLDVYTGRSVEKHQILYKLIDVLASILVTEIVNPESPMEKIKYKISLIINLNIRYRIYYGGFLLFPETILRKIANLRKIAKICSKSILSRSERAYIRKMIVPPSWVCGYTEMKNINRYFNDLFYL